MSEGMMVTPLGYKLLQRKKEQLEKVILTTQESLADMAQGDSGDGFQDSFLLETQMKIQRMDYELQEIKGLLGQATITLEPQQTDTVSIGHRVVLTLVYPSGEHEALIVVLTASPELSLVEDHLQSGELPVSPNSALGRAIYGGTSGSLFSYEIEGGTVNGQILKIEVWQPAFKLQEQPCYETISQ
jgi:transcription elongation GreA/GreB family factor